LIQIDKELENEVNNKNDVGNNTEKKSKENYVVVGSSFKHKRM